MSIPSDAIVHVLIVDDELQIRELSKEFLEEVGGIEVETAASAREARGAHGRIGFDAIVSDYQMPEEDGIQFLKSLRTNGDLTPFILFTGKGREDVVIEALNNGADSYLQKGGNPRSLYAELEQRIRVAVGKRRAERDVDQRNRELQRANHELGTADVELRAQLDEIETSNEELRAKDETLRSSEARFTNLFENMSSGVAIHAIILDPAGIPYDYRFLNANHAFEKMTGMERSVILGRTVREVLHQIEPIWIERYGRVALTGVADHFESHSAALERDFSVSVYRNDPGQFTTLILDITERVRQEKKQRDLSIKYQTLLRTLPIGVTISDDKGNIIESNEEATRLLGLSIEEQKRRSIAGEEWKIVRSDGTLMPPEEYASTRALTEGRTISNVEMGLVDGKHCTWIDVTAAPVPLEGYGVAITYIDISKRRANENDLRERMKELQAFYQLSDMAEQKDLGLEDIYQKMADALPDSMQYPKIACAKIAVDGHEYRTDNFRETKWKHSVPIKVRGLAAGFIEIDYREKMVESDRGTFLKEEMKLIRAIAEMVGRIIERKQAEAEIKHLHSELQIIFDNTPAMIWYKDTKNNLVRVNKAAAASMGLAVDQSEGHNTGDLLPQEAEEYYRDDLEVMANGQPKLGIEEKLKTSQGETLWVRTDKIPLRDSAGKVSGILVISQDVTGRRRIEDELRKLAKAAENSPACIVITDIDGNIEWVNPKFTSLTGYTLEEAKGQNPRILKSGETPKEEYQRMYQIILGRGTWHGEFHNKKKNGELYWESVSIAPIFDDAGKIAHFIASKEDISERKLMEKALQEANRKLNLLSSITRHDINNQMTILEGNLALLKKGQPQLISDDHLGRVEMAAGKISTTILFTKEYQDIGVKAPIWVSPGRQTKEAFAMMHLAEVKLEDDTKGIEVLADPLVEKIPYNLIDNSMRHGEHVTRIKMSAEQRGDAMLIAYEDNGAGISAEDKKRLFEKGFGKNTGFGLFLCREIMAITGITITETGKAGEGVCFEMLVPPGAWRLPPR